jgi:hypothetical protein
MADQQGITGGFSESLMPWREVRMPKYEKQPELLIRIPQGKDHPEGDSALKFIALHQVQVRRVIRLEVMDGDRHVQFLLTPDHLRHLGKCFVSYADTCLAPGAPGEALQVDGGLPARPVSPGPLPSQAPGPCLWSWRELP